jgi:hypothetical protein
MTMEDEQGLSAICTQISPECYVELALGSVASSAHDSFGDDFGQWSVTVPDHASDGRALFPPAANGCK